MLCVLYLELFGAIRSRAEPSYRARSLINIVNSITPLTRFPAFLYYITVLLQSLTRPDRHPTRYIAIPLKMVLCHIAACIPHTGRQRATGYSL